MKNKPNQPLDILAPEMTDITEHDYSKKPLVSYYPDFIPDHDQVFEHLMADVQQLSSIMRVDDDFGNRRTTTNLWRVDPRIASGSFARRMASAGELARVGKLNPMTPTAGMIAGRFWAAAGQMPDDVQLCLYRNGRDHCAPHADDATLVGPTLKNQVIGIFSFGATRKMNFYRMDTYRADEEGRPAVEPDHQLELEAGSLVVMHGETQWHWLHEIPPSVTKRPRISVSTIYYQDLRNLRDAPYRLMQVPRSKGYRDAMPYMLHRHIGTPEECLARWEEIRASEGVPPHAIRDTFQKRVEAAIAEHVTKPEYDDFERHGEYAEAHGKYTEASAKLMPEAIERALKEVHIGPRLAMISPMGKEISYRDAQDRWGSDEASEAPAGIDCRIWRQAQRLLKRADAADA